MRKIIKHNTRTNGIRNRIYLLAAIILVSVCFQVSVGQSQSNRLSFNHFSVDDGLTLDNEAFLFRDSKGFLWIGAFMVQRFDGYEFKKYTVNVDDTISLKTRVYCIEEDTTGDLWFGAANSIARYYHKKDYFKHYNIAFDNEDNEIPFSTEVYGLLRDKHGDVWVTTNGFFKYNREKDRFESVPLNLPQGVDSEYVAGNSIYSGYHKERDEIYIAVDYYGIIIYSLEEKTSRFIPDGEGFSGGKVLYQKVFIDQDGKVWFATASQGVKMYDPQFDAFTLFTPDPEKIKNHKTVNYFDIRDIGDMGDGRVAFGTDANGLNIYDPETRLFEYYNHDFRDENSIATNGVHMITRGLQNILWLWCFDGGLSYFDPSWKKFHHIRKTGKYNNELSGNAIISFAEDSLGNFYIATKNNGLNYWNRSLNRFSRINLSDNQTNQQVNDLAEIRIDNEQNVWVASLNQGIFMKKAEEDTFRHYYYSPANPNTIPGNTISNIDVDDKGWLWFGYADDTKDNLAFYTPATNTFETVSRENILTENSETIPADNINQIYTDTKNNIWLALSIHGITVIQPDNIGYTAKNYSPGEILKTKSTDELQVYDFYENAQTEQLILSTNSGLIIYDYQEKNFTKLEIESIETMSRNSILMDSSNTYWLATNNGLIRTDTDFEHKTLFTIDEGIQGSVFFPGAKYMSSRGELLFGGNNGFNIFFPKEIKENTFLPPTFITGLEINYEEVNHFIADSLLKKDIKYIDSLKLTYNQSALSFSFVGLNFTKPENNQYRYKMQGLQDRWIDIGTQREVSFANLPPGKYTFLVQSSNNDGVWNPDPASIYIRITPPWWGSWWFYSIIGLLVMAIIALYLKIRENERKKDQKTLQEAITKGQNEIAQQKKIVKDLETKLEEKNKEEFELRWQNKGSVKLGEVINNSKDNLDTLLTNINLALCEYLEANHTAIYLRENINDSSAEEHLILKATTLEKSKSIINTLSFIPGEGLVGVCFRDREIEQFDNVPASYLEDRKEESEEELLNKNYNNYLTLVPLKLDEYIEGVIEIFSDERLSDYKIDFLSKITQDITANIISMKATANIEDVLSKSEKQQQSLEEQEINLTKNLEEIKIEHEKAEKEEEALKLAIEKEKKRYQELKDKLSAL